MLALRNPLDTDETATKGVRVAAPVRARRPHRRRSQLGCERRRAPVKAEPAPARSTRAQGYTVEAIRAAKRAEEIVR